MKSATSRNFHLPLPDDLYAELREAAKKRGRPATVVARDAIATWLRQVRRIEISEAIASYATQQAGTPADLDEALEGAGIDSWMNSKR